VAKKQSGIKAMKLIAIKNECFAITDTTNLSELKRKYATLCKGRDFRKRATWEYVLKRLRTDGDWMGIKLSKIERLELEEQSRNVASPISGALTFWPERVEWDKAAENDD
jgi:hypothetical protein